MSEENINVYRRYALAGATFSVAISIGFLMQTSEPSYAAHRLPKAKTPVATSDATQASLSGTTEIQPDQNYVPSAIPVPPQDAVAHQALPAQPVVLLVSRDKPVGVLPQEESTPFLNCKPSLTAESGAAAMVNLTLLAPCLSGDRVTIHHSGLKFTEIVGVDGDLNVAVPALSEKAVFVVAFTNGDGAVAQTTVDSLTFYDRVAVQWKGQTGLELHAREYGAAYGTTGHVWRGGPRDVSAVAGGEGGFLAQLGNPETADALIAEVYTFPSGTAQNEGTVMLSLEAEVTASNCNNHVSAQTIEVQPDGDLRTHEMELSLPDCEATGEFLVLKNLLEDLTIASN
ncbi:hypothetical protein SAMN05444000_11417 [Shimia gijangensis]|uniref:Translocase n=1 Tax=Shimia gijangensis TaxID=1470563 RepID=A0A1M6MMK4_9RHOB|nr:hypothetical protein [Shimia gijangensis]SHJ84513.1 hypothetical protein SAMN05444000_11417 [Shimia gijangensis]